MYHFKESHVKVTLEWLKQKNGFADFLTIMKGWWSEGQFRANYAFVEWNTLKFRKRIHVIVIFLSRMFGRKYGSTFPDKWINTELRWTHFIQDWYLVEEISERTSTLYVFIFTRCDVCQHRVSISWVEMGAHPFVSPCLLQNVMGKKIQGGLWIDL